MNASLRLLALLLLILLPALSPSAEARDRSADGPARYSLVEEYKGAYAKPRARRSFFGFGKPRKANHGYKKVRRTRRMFS
jgi:hypothetical protein